MGLGYEADGTYYDGNIRSQSWRTAGDGQERSYTYSYDGLSRLTGASGSGAGVVSVTGMSHDANGNLQHMDRAGIDNLSYRYAANSNKLLAVSDTTNNTAGFSDGNTSGDDYAYDVAICG